MSNQSDIIQGCIKQSRKAQKALYEQYAPVMLGICSRYATDIAEAEDILQEGFLKIFQNISSYSGSGNFAGWMKRIMVNTAITLYHKNKKHYYHDEIEDVQNDIQDHITPESELSAQDLYNLIKQMPQGYKMIFNLYAIEGYKHHEIADQLKIKESTSKSQYMRAKKWMAKELEKMEKIANGEEV